MSDPNGVVNIVSDPNGVVQWRYLGSVFTIDRNSGKMIGLPFSTESYESVTVLDKGSKDNSYKAIDLSDGPNIWVKYIYVAEHNSGMEKPFWSTDDGNKIFSGICK